MLDVTDIPSRSDHAGIVINRTAKRDVHSFLNQARDRSAASKDDEISFKNNRVVRHVAMSHIFIDNFLDQATKLAVVRV